jgi:hypothetical protein
MLVFLLPLDADHRRTRTNHIEFNRCGAAEIDNTPSTIRPAIYNTNDNSLAVMMVSDQHLVQMATCGVLQ